VLALDVRERAPYFTPLAGVPGHQPTREEMIDNAKKQIDTYCDALLKEGKDQNISTDGGNEGMRSDERPLADTHDICMLAFLHEVLLSDVSQMATKSMKKAEAKFEPLYLAIVRAEHEMNGYGEHTEVDRPGVVPKATPAQISDTARWLSNRIFQDAWKVKDPESKKGITFQEFYGDLIYAQTIHFRTLLSSERFFSTK